MTKTILHVLDHSIPLQSGYAFRSRSIIRTQRELGWHTVHLTSSKHWLSARENNRQAKQSIDDLDFHRTFPGRLSHLPILRQWDVIRTLTARIIAISRSERIDLIHAHSPCLNGIAALHAARKLRLPVVYEVRAFWEDAAVDQGTSRENGMRYRLTRELESYVLRRVDAITCICEGLRSEILGRGVAPEHVTVIPNAVNVTQFPPLRGRDDVLESSLDLRGCRVLGFMGSFYGYEGLDLLIAALPKILSREPNTILLLVGGGPEEAALRTQAQTLGVGNQVIFTGRVPHEQITRYASLVDVFVFPRKSMRLTELVTPLKPLEAMALRRLVLASNVGGHRELIDNEKTGLLFQHDSIDELASAAISALTRLGTCDALLDRARIFVEEVRNWSNSVERYRTVYQHAHERSNSANYSVKHADAHMNSRNAS